MGAVFAAFHNTVQMNQLEYLDIDFRNSIIPISHQVGILQLLQRTSRVKHLNILFREISNATIHALVHTLATDSCLEELTFRPVQADLLIFGTLIDLIPKKVKRSTLHATVVVFSLAINT